MAELDCQETKKHVHEFLQAELTDQEMDDIVAHLATCDSCDGTYGAENILNSVIQRSCNEEPADKLATKILFNIRAVLNNGHPDDKDEAQ